MNALIDSPPVLLTAHLSDLHIDRSGPRSAVGARLMRIVADINAFYPPIDAVFITGDLVEAGTYEEYRHLRRLTAPLRMPVFVVPGNHDDRDALRQTLHDGQYFDPASPWLHYSARCGGLRIIGLDTTHGQRPEGRLCAQRLAWLGETLAEAQGTPTVLLMHHPPTDTGVDYMDAIGLLEGADALGELLTRNPQVCLTMCGHVHRPIQLTWRGHSVCVGGSPSSQLALQLGTDTPTLVRDPYRYFIHRIRGTDVATHLRYLK